MPPGKFVHVERQIFFADMMELPHNSAFQKRPKGIDAGSVNSPAHVFALAVPDGLVIVILVQEPIAGMLIC
jgi:hypothetical protein